MISKMSNAPIHGPARVAIVPSGFSGQLLHAVNGASETARRDPLRP
jgi:hypothetical protein